MNSVVKKVAPVPPARIEALQMEARIRKLPYQARKIALAKLSMLREKAQKQGREFIEAKRASL